MQYETGGNFIMKNSFAKLLLSLTVLTLILLAAGCSSSSLVGAVKSPDNGGGSALSSKGLNDIKGMLGLEVGGHYPDNYGLSRVYGTVTNGSKQNLKSVTLAISFGKRGQGIKVGEAEVSDLKAGEKKSFDVATTVNASNQGEYNINLIGATQ